MIDYFQIIAITFIVYYFYTVILFIFGLIKTSIVKKTSNQLIPVSIIVAVRNGEKNLPRLLEALIQQSYLGLMEFIIVDDESCDQTKQIINKWQKKDDRIKYQTSLKGNSKLKYKKRALDAGIKIAKNNFFIFTDVDCLPTKDWVVGMVQQFNSGADYVVGLSIVPYAKSLVSQFQRIDFLISMFAAHGMVCLGYAWGCSGQNQGYTRDVYINNNRFSKIKHLLQGDDSIFLQVSRKKSICVLSNNQENSYVESRIESSWKSFIMQRIRWASDGSIMWKYNKIFYLSLLSAFFTNFLFFISPFLAYLKIILISDIIWFLLIKLFLEYILFRVGCKKNQIFCNHFQFLFWFILQIPYVLFVGFFSFLNIQFNWRGRKFQQQ